MPIKDIWGGQERMWEHEEYSTSWEAPDWYWEKQVPGTVLLPDFIQKRAIGEAKMEDGFIYLKKPGPDPELMKILHARLEDTNKQMMEMMSKALYGGLEGK